MDLRSDVLLLLLLLSYVNKYNTQPITGRKQQQIFKNQNS